MSTFSIEAKSGQDLRSLSVEELMALTTEFKPCLECEGSGEDDNELIDMIDRFYVISKEG